MFAFLVNSRFKGILAIANQAKVIDKDQDPTFA
jgi:hypothetical protein